MHKELKELREAELNSKGRPRDGSGVDALTEGQEELRYRLKVACLFQDVTTNQMCRAMGLQASTVYRWLRNDAEPTGRGSTQLSVDRIAEWLDIPAEYLQVGGPWLWASTPPRGS
ncbi:MAG: helix-turn-helix transcriptional regulator [Actinomycetales bacterium]|nr:helix-turn-helix transcriptional regulator [Actinomycetales bacterium]